MGTMDLGKYSKQNLSKVKKFTPTDEHGNEFEGIKIGVISVKSDKVIDVMNSIIASTRSDKVSLKKGIHNDIDLACAVTESIEGISINGRKLESTPEDIKYLLTEVELIRSQVIKVAQDDTFFFSD